MEADGNLFLALQAVLRLTDPAEAMLLSERAAAHAEYLEDFYEVEGVSGRTQHSISRIRDLLNHGDSLRGPDLVLLACLTLGDTSGFAARQVRIQLELCNQKIGNVTSALELLKKRGHVHVEHQEKGRKRYSVTEVGHSFGQELVEKLALISKEANKGGLHAAADVVGRE